MRGRVEVVIANPADETFCLRKRRGSKGMSRRDITGRWKKGDGETLKKISLFNVLGS